MWKFHILAHQNRIFGYNLIHFGSRMGQNDADFDQKISILAPDRL